jgi:HEAT repeat protein
MDHGSTHPLGGYLYYHTGTLDPHTLIVDLKNDNGRVRRRAREELAELGPAAAPELVYLFNHSDTMTRWEAAKALVEIGDPSIVPVLIQALEDEHADIRWLAAEGLVGVGSPAIVPLLRALIAHPESVWLRRRAHHVLHALARGDLADILTPVLVPMQDVEPVLEVPVAAHMAITQLNWPSP